MVKEFGGPRTLNLTITTKPGREICPGLNTKRYGQSQTIIEPKNNTEKRGNL